MSLGMFPHDVITSCLYMSMGIAVPGAMGYQVATGKRPVVLVGDGAFHMTGMELMHARRFGVSPIVIVLNNRKWTSLSVEEADEPLTRQRALEFARMAHFFDIKAFTATTAGELRHGLAEAYAVDETVVIDAQVAPDQRSYLCERFFDAIKAQHHLPRA
jgi:indolepyruvate decarboxylase